MTWTPKPGFSGVMEDVVVPNVAMIIERDFKDALDYYFPDEQLLDFHERSMGQVKRKEFPCVAVGPLGNAADESEDSARHTQPLRISIYLMIEGPDDETVTTNIMRYVKTMHGVLHKASWADYFGADVTRTFGQSLSVEHFYSPLLSNNTLLARAASMLLTLKFDSR